ncbi:prefoldin alpha-like domain containing protein [Heterostelium album PN500]|uniref:Prefoldin subunit 3 n=1 Tax=Heterostelium pallidum (strain ATCC 26659 / Pp 5 / PN500) TaxID=670386 RepID=D3B957_HETP5|nr:prefoldin alpha-like domain containing protein [Heterostelium album PN500]EFA82096.1 prefoldin alpha-like domain containing protein [Heterostelium album PN500]|eukprot:XP_020434213.1 prefoldin alpha-like domain containing protein [Heterostelium album PN500]
MSIAEDSPYKVLFDRDQKSASGIPAVTFIEDVEAYLKDKELEDVFKMLQDSHGKYKYFEQKLSGNVSILTNRAKQLQETIDVDDTFSMNYELSEGVYSSAEISKPQSIYLWLGANVMLEYSFTEAKEVLRKNKETADRQLRETIQDLGFVKDQITTVDVNISRVYNYDVIQRRKKQQPTSAMAPIEK